VVADRRSQADELEDRVLRGFFSHTDGKNLSDYTCSETMRTDMKLLAEPAALDKL
jgi:hypothetical protein